MCIFFPRHCSILNLVSSTARYCRIPFPPFVMPLGFDRVNNFLLEWLQQVLDCQMDDFGNHNNYFGCH